ncbi:cellulose biosynthesis cyclic di-GMP-binding regulatory protein BcsB [Weissella koreensis]|uniref:cellulose biosynthesis cyclic di-GMP-binding regulatory protein BcsB n=1 Tax=Weissella koreensis TaxID=165096 RepID=UPI001FA7A1CC|nr:cellulose biosynthesis cyclic di-GMP-binding regulatory protein BcsB [Weissella koreensis]
MLENKFFIKKPSGIRLNGISKKFQGILLLIALILGMIYGSTTIVWADNNNENKNFSQNFNNSNMTISGETVQEDVFFNKMDYWDVNKGTINFNFKVSQLDDYNVSDLTLSMNGIKFYSFRPDATDDIQNKTIDVPVDLLQGSNHLQISGQTFNQSDNNTTLLATPANWLTVYQDSNINLDYSLSEADDKINQFYDHFTGFDTVINQKSAIRINTNLSDPELEANLYALSGIDGVVSDKGKISLINSDDQAINNYDYQIIISKQAHLPEQFKEVGKDLGQQEACIKAINDQGKHYLVVTAKTNKQLIKAARFVSNSELMKETQQANKKISTKTETYLASPTNKFVQEISSNDTTLSGSGHQEATYSLEMPKARNNANGSTILLHTKYAKNIDFSKSLVTVELDGKKIGSHQLTAKKADNDTFEIKIPNGQALGKGFNIKVIFDMVNNQSSLNQTPWAIIEKQSKVTIKTEPMNNLLFSNYPSTFIKNKTYEHIALIRPEKLNSIYLDTLSSLFNGIGSYVEQNTGQIKVYHKTPNKTQLANSSIITFGTPKDNQFIRNSNNDLYFKFDHHFKNIVSNEKMSLESNYSRKIGTAQLLRSPYNQKRSILILTAIHEQDVAMAANTVSSQSGLSQVDGDAIVIDRDNQQKTYRFKKDIAADAKLDLDLRLKRNQKLIVYLVVFTLILISLIGVIIVILYKNDNLRFGRNNHER